jgi:hypothetical protein
MIKIRGYCRFDYAKVCAALARHEQPVAEVSTQSQATPTTAEA